VSQRELGGAVGAAAEDSGVRGRHWAILWIGKKAPDLGLTTSDCE
jgi:hypothetical protein